MMADDREIGSKLSHQEALTVVWGDIKYSKQTHNLKVK